MRVDLRLQGAQLHVLEVFAEIVALVNQEADPAHHEVEAVLQLADLVLAVYDAAYAEVAALHAPHLLGERFDPAGAVAGVEVGEEKGDDADDDGEQNHLIAQVGAWGEQIVDRSDGENPPALKHGRRKAEHGVSGDVNAGGCAEFVPQPAELLRYIVFGKRKCRICAADDA